MPSLPKMLTIAVSAIALPLTVAAAPVYSALTGNYYDYINQDRLTGQYTSWNWLEAKADAEARSFMGRTGHLVTITSAAEEQILIDNWIADILYGQAIIGGFRPADADPVSGWQWVTGEAFTYQRFAPNEPNNAGGGELYLHYQSIGVASTTQYVSYGWNDMLNERRGYFIEYSAPLPAPGTLALVAIAGLGLLASAQRRRQA